MLRLKASRWLKNDSRHAFFTSVVQSFPRQIGRDSRQELWLNLATSPVRYARGHGGAEPHRFRDRIALALSMSASPMRVPGSCPSLRGQARSAAAPCATSLRSARPNFCTGASNSSIASSSCFSPLAWRSCAAARTAATAARYSSISLRKSSRVLRLERVLQPEVKAERVVELEHRAVERGALGGVRLADAFAFDCARRPADP